MSGQTDDAAVVPNRTVDGEPSVCTWDLSFSFLVKEQATTFLNRYMSQDVPLLFTYSEVEDEDDTLRYVIDVSGLTANHLARVAVLLDSVDFRDQQTPFVMVSNEDRD